MIEEIKKLEKTTCFKKTDIDSVILYFFYINNNVLENVETDYLEINEKTIDQKTINSKFTEHKHYDGKTYSLSGLHSYNFNVSSLCEYIEEGTNDNFIKYSSIRNIEFPKTIEQFTDYSSLFFILENKRKKTMTKKANEISKNKTVKHTSN